jgi:acyl carrier protein
MRHLLPSTSVADRVLAKMAVLLDCDRARLDVRQRLEVDLDFTALERVQIALDFEDADGCRVSMDEVARASTVQDLVDVIADASRRAARQGQRPRNPDHAAGSRAYGEWLARGLRRGKLVGRVAA